MPKDVAPLTLTVSIGRYSDAGRKPENQDCCGARIPEGSELSLKGITLAVADGISSSEISLEASEASVQALLTDYYATSDAWTARTAATTVISAMNAWLYGQNVSLGDMNVGKICTLSALILKGRDGHIFHLGDSRVSRLIDGSLEPLTVDHRTVLSNEESYLARGMGLDAQVMVDYRRVSLTEGEVFVLTTDGVHEVIDAEDVKAALEEPDLDAAAKRLGQIAFDKGSDDNLTVMLAQVETLPEGEDALELDLAKLPLPALPKAGEVIDGFRILRPVNSTARSHVYLAEGLDGGKVALKIPTVEMADDAAYLNRFVLEEWIARRLSSSHVLRAAKGPETRTALYVVTEWVEGRTLRQWMDDHPEPDLDKVRDIISQIVVGLRAFHRKEMLHQDLRPENIMIDDDGTVKIIDLGSTSVAGVEEATAGVLGLMPGTFQYTAPEYFSGDFVTWRSDQYSLGVIAYELLTGRLPYGAEVARIENRRDLLRLKYRPARDDESPVPAWMDAALKRATQPEAGRRYDALSEFVAELKRPGQTWQAARHVPLMEKNPVRFWQGVSAALAVLSIALTLQLLN
ncbi:bifunctional protein-serine/threonine kinase/phosphatase [Celeribacter litoreus]|uniref:bifunctional protein-serine/threonine kinase/phosphatase n=1 Tax=Celeribacter litoreus TaxID=2876714 RepID=UPI001CCEF236|nr:bifunctional protein-serine/threonine kinase/phosphatase [Celeribacter litoreus]MCA0042236.1 bifunctional protein-serine/threonine kinase/phosphatase [Celeribacter litoreus]